MRLSLLLLSLLSVVLQSDGAVLFGQVANSGVDRPTQRWIPFPGGQQAELSKQAELLKQIRDAVAAPAMAPEMPALSDEQLKEMEKAFEKWRDIAGDDQLPDLSSIPKEWIEAAVPDPKQRKQAQELLERYARERDLPSPWRGNSPSQDGVRLPDPFSTGAGDSPAGNEPSDKRNPLRKRAENDSSQKLRTPKNQTSARQPSGPQGSNPPQSRIEPAADGLVDKPSNSAAGQSNTNGSQSAESQNQSTRRSNGGAPKTNAEATRPTKSGPTPEFPPSLSTPADPGAADRGPNAEPLDPKRLEALKALLSRLQQQVADEPRFQPDSAAPQTRSGPKQSNSFTNRPQSSASSSLPTRPSGREARQSSPSISQLSESTRSNSSRRLNPSNPSSSGRDDQGIARSQGGPGSEKPSAENRPSAENSAPRIARTGPSGQAPTTRPKSQVTRTPQTQTPSPQSQLSAEKLAELLGEGARSGRPSQASNSEPSSPSSASESAGSATARRNIKEQVERFGLGATLRGIVDKTLKEQGADKNPSQIIESIQKITNVDIKPTKPAARTNRQPSTGWGSKPTRPAPVNSTKPSPAKPRPTKPSPTKPSPTVSASQQSNSSKQSGGKSDDGVSALVADVWKAISTTPNSESSAAAASGNSAASEGSFNFRVGWREWGVLGLAAVICGVLLFLAKKRRDISAEAAVQQAASVKQILQAGLRTRADVVAAFHRFVLRRPYAAADWWTHRYVVKKLRESSPQIGTPIQELALVYEQARYLPASVELSPEQLNRAEAAFKQCLACEA